MKKIIIIIAVIIVVIGTGLIIVFNILFSDMLKMTVHEYDNELTIFIGGGGNSIVLKGESNDIVIIVDTKMMGPAKKMKEYVDSLGGNPEIIVVNTHNHPDHVGGNKHFPNSRLITGAYNDKDRKDTTGQKQLPDIRLNPHEEYQLTIGQEVVIIKNMGQAHTLNDVIVYLTRRKILLTGDILFSQRHPVLIESGGSNAEKWLEVLNKLLENYPGSTVIPGHGDISDDSAIIALKVYFEDIKGAVGDKKEIGKLREKYKTWDKIPFMSGFNKTLTHFRKNSEK